MPNRRFDDDSEDEQARTITIKIDVHVSVCPGDFYPFKMRTAGLPELPADATLIAFSISCGWALSMTFSPFATVVLIIARGSGIPAHVLTLRWNLGFTLIATALLFPIFFLMTGGQ